MTREEALELVKENVENVNTIKHMLATEAIMQALAERLDEDQDKWGITGLLHDIDMELTEGDMTNHSRLGADLVREMGVSEEIAHAILTHNEAHDIPRESKLDKALFCTDPLTGLVTAAALVRPDKKIAGVEVKSIKKRFKEKSFAAGANRENMATCNELGIELDEFLEIGLRAMQSIAEDLGL